MPEYDLVIRGGTVATATGRLPADVAIRGERIAAIGQGLPAGSAEIDATGPAACCPAGSTATATSSS